ncbi:hypothetical protein OG596_38080 (plasmid) [Streptomyces sp. NBC_01102]|uniref:hypothetical protein n=1 Tax=Streptomyces sp. NBC_01102 TaxID=2903749 RepID=UPI002F90D2F3|nr:hypothetical protein OG596_38080 [Streptomyces sp. NBC_01102]
MDRLEWEELHQQSYRQGAWPRAERSAGALMRRHTGRDPHDIERIEQEGTGTPAEQAEMVSTWLPVTRLVALAVWRAARDADCRIDDTELARALWWLGGQGAPDLFAEPLPPWTGLPGNWKRLEQRLLPDLLERARWVVTQQLLAHDQDPLADSDDGTAVLLGDRIRAIKSEPFRDGAPPRWTLAVEHANKVVMQAQIAVSGGLWHPRPGAQDAAAQLRPTLSSEPDAPPAPAEVTVYTWIQRLVRLAHIDTTISTVLCHHGDRREAELEGLPQAPFGQAVRASGVALSGLVPTINDLDELWTRRTEGVAAWERTHIPLAVRAHAMALEDVVASLSRLAAYVMNPDAPH